MRHVDNLKYREAGPFRENRERQRSRLRTRLPVPRNGRLLPSSFLVSADISLKKKKKKMGGVGYLGNGSFESSLKWSSLQRRVNIGAGGLCGAVSLSFVQKASLSRLRPDQTELGSSRLPPEIRYANGENDFFFFN